MSGATLRKKELPLATAPVHKLVLSFMLTALASAAVFAVRGRSLFLCALPYERGSRSAVSQ